MTRARYKAKYGQRKIKRAKSWKKKKPGKDRVWGFRGQNLTTSYKLRERSVLLSLLAYIIEGGIVLTA